MGLTEPQYEEGQTPLDEDEKDGLQLPSVTTRSELDEVEQRNIEEAIRWTMERRRRFTVAEILTEDFVQELHQRMLGGVWKWAGTFRKSDKNIGADKYQIPMELRTLLDDCKFWIEHETFSEDEIAIRFKHRIVSIHCFANGNGRHSRLIADVIIEKIFGRDVFTWGRADLIRGGGFRSTYLQALREADKGNYAPLLKFARS
jgi:Fic-DOC domain mobile mystery protein B